ncbi:inner arm dynein, group 5 [Achlya hypogyna]|uniref:Inner arm dynein, group 5 n=1 Tax=Achlya hypogyna TaxID=1202772 RepID=A0A1V9YA83_ACHHY|nr:inner arm dynein, group 5 [Achlya hypogyna]
MPRRALSHPNILAFAERANQRHATPVHPNAPLDALPLKEQLLRRVAATASQGAPPSQSSPTACLQHNPSNNDEIDTSPIDTADKLLEYTLHVIDTKTRVLPQYIHIKEVRSVQDAVFVPQRKPLDIIYLHFNAHPPCHFRNVYWLTRAPSDMDLRDDYFTLTSYGLTRFMGLESELFDLEAWLREKAIFDKIVQMTCIQQIRKMTVFHTWKRNTIGLRIEHAKKTVDANLLACHPVTAPLLLVVQTHVLQIEATLSIDLVAKGNPQPIERLAATRVPTEASRASVAAILGRLEALVLDALHRLLAAPNAHVANVRYCTRGANADVVPALIRAVDFMVVGGLFRGTMAALERLNLSITGAALSGLEAPTTAVAAVSVAAATRDRYLHMDQLQTVPTEHSGNVAYKRLFHLQGAALPDALFYLEMVVDDVVTVTPTEDVSVRHLHDAMAHAIESLDAYPRLIDAPRVRQFVLDHGRPFYRHCFGLHLLPASATVRNHAVVEQIMKGLRAAMDIYYVEIEELAMASRLVHVEFLRLQDHMPPEDEAASDDLQSFVAGLEHVQQFHADLRLVDSLLQIGPFLVNRSAFIGGSLHACTDMLHRLFLLAPERCNAYYQSVHARCIRSTRLISSIPDSLDETMAWLQCVLEQRALVRNQAAEDPATRLQGLLAVCDTSCPRITYDVKSRLVAATKTDQVKWRAAIKSLLESLARIDANTPFFMDLLTRTMTVRRETLTTELAMLRKKLDREWEAIQAEDTAAHGPAGSFYGRAKGLPDLMAQTKQLLRTDDDLHIFTRLIQAFGANNAGFCLREPKAATATQHEMLEALVLLTDNIRRFVMLREENAQVPLACVDLSTLSLTTDAMAWTCQPLQAVLGEAHPLLARFQRYFSVFQKALATAAVLLRFDAPRWAAAGESPATATLSWVEAQLAVPGTKAALLQLTEQCTLDNRVAKTWRAVQAQLAAVELVFAPSHHVMLLANVHDLLLACDDMGLSLLSIQHADNDRLAQVQATQTLLQRATVTLRQIDRVQDHWQAIGIIVELPDTRKLCDESDLWRAMEAANSAWRERMMALFHTVELQPHLSALEKLDTAVGAFDFAAYVATCERLAAALAAYLAHIRRECPRLYFLCDADLRNLVTTPQSVEEVVVRCFPSIERVQVAAEATMPAEPTPGADFTQWMLSGHAVAAVKAVTFRNGWRLQLPAPFRVVGSLVFWLARLDAELRRALQATVAIARETVVYDPSLPHIREWLDTMPLQLVVLYVHFRFSCAVTDVLVPKATVLTAKLLLGSTTAQHHTQFIKLVASMRNPRNFPTLSALETLVLLFKYQLDTLERLAAVAKTSEWSDVAATFRGSLRCVAAPRDDVHLLVAMDHVTTPCDVHVQTSAPLLVVTPATERCMYALLHVLRLNVCALPFGLVGKRTLVHGASNLLMRFFVNFSCAEPPAPTTLACLLSGLAALRGWGVLPGALALPRDVLRVFLADVLQLHHAHFGRTTQWRDDDGGFGLFLPWDAPTPPPHVTQWLGQPLRPLAVLAPERPVLLQCLLHTKGFTEPMHHEVEGLLVLLSTVEPKAAPFLTFSLLQRIAGLAAAIVKSVSYIIHASAHTATHLTHELSPLNIVRYKDANVLRFALLLVLHPLVDETTLHAAVDRFFPSTMVMGQEFRMFEAAAKVVLQKAGLIAEPSLVTKTVELYNFLQTPTPTILLGPTGSGKSSCIKACLQTQQLVRWTMCPQADPSAHLAKRIDLVVLGLFEIDAMTAHSHSRLHALQNAVVHTFCRRTPAAEKETMRCVVFDGVLPARGPSLDCLLSLLNAEELVSLPQQPRQLRVARFDHLLLETTTLADASPALVTRCNILVLNPDILSWPVLVAAWLARQLPDVAAATDATLTSCVRDLLLPAVEALQRPGCPSTVAQMTTNALRLLSAIVAAVLHGAATWPLKASVTSQVVFLMVVWGFGAHLESADRLRLQSAVLDAASGHDDVARLLQRFPGLPHSTCPTLFEIYFNVRDHTFGTTSSRPEWTAALPRPASALVVPTPTLTYACAVFALLQTPQHETSVMIVGGAGAGKSTCLSVLRHLASPVKGVHRWSKWAVADRYARLLRGLVRSEPSWIFIDDVDLYGDASLRLLRGALVHRRLFDPAKDCWASLAPTLCASSSNAPEAAASHHQRFLRPFVVVQLTEPTPSEIGTILAAVAGARLGRCLTSLESHLVHASVHTKLHFQGKHPASPIVPRVLDDLLRRTLVSAVDDAGATARWVRACQASFLAPLESEADRHAGRQHMRSAAEPLVCLSPQATADVVVLADAVQALPLPDTTIQAIANDPESTWRHLREWLVSTQPVGAKATPWIARMSSPLVWHWVQLMDAVHTSSHVVCMGSPDVLEAYLPLVALVTQAASLPASPALADFASERDCMAFIREVLKDTGVHQKKRLLSVQATDLAKWPVLADVILDIVEGNHLPVAKAIALEHVVTDQTADVDALDAFLQRVNEHLTLVLWGTALHCTQRAATAVLFVALAPPLELKSDLLDAAMGAMAHLQAQHPELTLSDADCAHLAAIAVGVHGTVDSPTKDLHQLLETFEHVLAYKAATTQSMSIGSVTRLLRWLDRLKAQYHSAADSIDCLERDRAACLRGQEDAVTATAGLQAKLQAAMGRNERLGEELRALQEAFGTDKHAIEAMDRQSRAERKVLEAVPLPPLTPSDRLRLHGEWGDVPACRHLFAALVGSARIDDVAALLDAPDLRQSLLDLPPKADSAPGHLSASDVPVLHVMHPLLAIVARLVLFQREEAAARLKVARLQAANRDRTRAIDDVRGEQLRVHAHIAKLESAIAREGAARDERAQQLATTVAALEVVQAEAAKVEPLLEYVDLLMALVRSKYFAQRLATHITSEGAALFMSCMISYLGPLDTPTRAALIHQWSVIFSTHQYMLPRVLGIVQDSSVALYSTLEASICAPNMDKRVVHGIAVADWSSRCPLIVDAYGLAEGSLTTFFQRIATASPAVAYSTYSCADANLLQCLEVAQKAHKVVLLTHFGPMADTVTRQLAPYLRVQRRPLLEAARVLPLLQHRGSSGKISSPTRRSTRSASIPELACGTFQVYLVLDPLVALASLSPLQRSLVNVIDLTPPLKELERRSRRMFHRLLEPADAKANDALNLQLLQANVQLRKQQNQALRELVEAASTLESNALVKLLAHLGQKDRSLRAYVAALPAPTNAPDDVDAASAVLARLHQALHTLQPLDPWALPRGRYMATLVERMFAAVAKTKPRPPVPVLLQRLLVRVYGHVARRLAAEHYPVFATMVALAVSVETPSEADLWLRFVAEPVQSVAALEKAAETGRRASDMRLPGGHVHRVRRLRSSLAVPSLAHGDALHAASLPQLVPAAVHVQLAHLAVDGFLSPEMYDGLAFLEAHVPALGGIGAHVRAHPETWRAILAAGLAAPELSLALPAPWSNLRPLHRLLLVKCVCPDLTVVFLEAFQRHALASLVPDAFASLQTITTPFVLLVCSADAQLPTRLPELGIDLDRRIVFQQQHPASVAALSSVLTTEWLEGGAVVVHLVASADAHYLVALCKQHMPVETKGLGPIFVLCDALLLPVLPSVLLHGAKILRLPLYPLLAPTAPAPGIVEHESHLHHSELAVLTRKLPLLHEEARARSRDAGVGWVAFRACDYHLAEAAATLYQLGEAGVTDATEAIRALQVGVYGADMPMRADFAALDALLRDPELTLLRTTELPGLRVYLRNTNFVRCAGQLHRALLVLFPPRPAVDAVGTLELFKTTLTSFLRKFQEIAMPGRSTKPGAAPRGQSAAVLEALRAVNFRLKADSNAFYHLLLHFVKCLSRVEAPDAVALEEHVLPHSWLGLPPTVSSVPLVAWVQYLDRRCDYLHFLGHPSAHAIDFALTFRPHELLSHVRVLYAEALGRHLSALQLVLRVPGTKQRATGGIAQDDLQRPCGFVVDGLWLFSCGVTRSSAFVKLDKVLLVWVDASTDNGIERIHLPFHHLWLLKHFSEASLGDSRVSTPIGDGVAVSEADCVALLGEDVPRTTLSHCVLLSPAIPEQHSVVALAQL